jgi:hypothetical protein
MSEARFTPGPWGWFGNTQTNHIYLATKHGGRRYVMDFTRWGMRGAQPRFHPERCGMVDVKDLVTFEVGQRSVVGVDQAKQDTSVYRYDIRGINHPDANLIAAAPELYEVLSEAMERGGVIQMGLYGKALAALAKARGETL